MMSEDERNIVYFGWDDDDDWDEDNCCPQCGSANVSWHGGDTFVTVGRQDLSRVDWFVCNECGYKWAEEV